MFLCVIGHDFSGNKPKSKPCSVELVRIEEPDQPKKYSFRERNTKPIEKKAKKIVPAKRNRRFESTPMVGTKSLYAQKSSLTQKRRRSDTNLTNDEDNVAKKKKTGVENDDMSQVVALNCKLTNEILKTKNLLFEKNNDIIKLQEQYHKKDIECITLKSSLKEINEEINELKSAYAALKEERFCSDLIKFDDDYDNNELQQQNGMYLL